MLWNICEKNSSHCHLNHSRYKQPYTFISNFIFLSFKTIAACHVTPKAVPCPENILENLLTFTKL